MQTKSTAQQNIEAAGGYHVEYKLNIAGTDIPASAVEELTLEGALFTEYSIGNCNLRTANITVQGNYSPGDVVKIYARVANATTAAGWVQLCQLVIYSRELVDGTYSVITAYDKLCQAEYVYKREPTWTDQTMAAVVNGICADLGLTLTTRATNLLPTYIVEDPNAMTARDLLCNIAAAAAANWCTTYDGKLDLIPLTVPAYVYDIQAGDIELDSYQSKITYSAWVGVELEGQSLVYRSPSGLDADQWDALKATGRIMEARCSWATQAMADAILTSLQSTTTQFSPWQMKGNVDICAELGDGVRVQGTRSVLGNYSLETAGGRLFGTIGAHGISNIANLSPYTPKVERQIAAEADFRRAQIQVLDTAITAEVTERTTQGAALQDGITDNSQGIIDLRSSLTQTATSLEATLSSAITTLEEYADAAADTAATDLANELLTYIRYYQSGGTGVLELGDNASGYVAKLTDTELGFYDGDTKVAYISNNKLYITNAEITGNLQIGKYQWITDSTGRMSLKWVG